MSASPHLPRATVFLLVACGFATAGCVSQRRTDPARTAAEQLLISTAADRAIAQLDLGLEKGARVALDDTYLEAYDEPYVTAALRDHLLRKGVRLEKDAAQADLVIEARSGGLSIDQSDRLLGLPAIEIPIPLAAGTLKTPELAIFKRDAQIATGKLALTAYRRTDGVAVAATGPRQGQAHLTRWTVLLIGWTSENIYEE